jgi:hypothetical protein
VALHETVLALGALGLASASPIDPAATLAKLRSALEAADTFVRAMPTAKIGLLFLEGAAVVQPNRSGSMRTRPIVASAAGTGLQARRSPRR